MEYYRYLNTDVYVQEQGNNHISLLQSLTMYPLSKFYSNDGEVVAMTNCSYFTSQYVLGRNQGDTSNEAPDQDFYSVVVRKDNSYACGKFASWEERDGIVAGFSPAVVLVKDGVDVELVSNAISGAKARLTTKNPNTAFGFLKNGKAVLIVNDGRTSSSTGLTGRDLRAFLKTKYELDLLVLLDGGGSSEMIVKGKIVNKLSDGAERKMWNALAFVDTTATQYALLPPRHTGITQGINGKTSHVGINAIDFGFNPGYEKQDLYAPFDCRVVWADDVAKGGTVALQSIKPVKWADGTEDFMTVISEHSSDRPDKGTVFKQGEVYAHMGKAATSGYHVHIEVQRGKFKKYTGTRYQSGIRSYVYVFPNTVYPYDALWVDGNTVLNDPLGLNYPWRRRTDVISSVSRDNTHDQIKVLVDLLRVRVDHSTKAESLGFAEQNGYYNYYSVYDDGTYKWYRIAEGQWVADNGEWLEILPKVNTNVEELKAEISKLQEEVESLTKSVKDLEQKNDTFKAENYKLKSMYDDLLEEKDRIASEYGVVSERLTEKLLLIQKVKEILS